MTTDIAEEAPPTLSVGLPVFNGALTLRETLECLRGQTFRDFEIIVSDNASTDASMDIVQDLAESRVRIFRHERGMAAIENFRFVRDKARGRYFTWAAADDLRDPDFFRRAVTLLDQNPHAVGAFGSIVHIDSSGNLLRSMRPLRLGGKTASLRLAALARYREDIAFYSVWRTKAVRSLQLKPWKLIPERPNNAAYPPLAGLLAVGPIVVDPEAVFRYRVHDRPHSRPMGFRVHFLVSVNTVLSSGFEVFRSTRSLRLALTSIAAFGAVQSYSVTRLLIRRLRGEVI